MILRSIETTKLPEILEYCRQLEAFQVSIGIPPADRLERFCIGFYQLSGTIGWKSTPCEDESWASAAIHFLVIMEDLGMSAENWIPRNLQELPRLHANWETLIFRASRATQMLFYARQAGKTIRSARYNKQQLESDLGMLVSSCFCAIATDRRAKAIYDATEILSKRV
jgi:hypothetical protein